MVAAIRWSRRSTEPVAIGVCHARDARFVGSKRRARFWEGRRPPPALGQGAHFGAATGDTVFCCDCANCGFHVLFRVQRRAFESLWSSSSRQQRNECRWAGRPMTIDALSDSKCISGSGVAKYVCVRPPLPIGPSLRRTEQADVRLPSRPR